MGVRNPPGLPYTLALRGADKSFQAIMTSTDKAKLAASLLLVAAGLVAFYTLHSLPGVARGAIVLVTVLAALGLMATSDLGGRFRAYAHDSYKEAKRVQWPTRKETLQMTGVVLVFVLLLAVFLSVVDWGLSKIVYSYLLNR
ncbi:preprotein translocase subunit SecE [Leeia sp.]|uniref:preprotein translocase subunit SecE n=1 Tax=Leeia sp. TaxID=2884678 RepID=UPI0035B1FB86